MDKRKLGGIDACVSPACLGAISMGTVMGADLFERAGVAFGALKRGFSLDSPDLRTMLFICRSLMEGAARSFFWSRTKP